MRMAIAEGVLLKRDSIFRVDEGRVEWMGWRAEDVCRRLSIEVDTSKVQWSLANQSGAGMDRGSPQLNSNVLLQAELPSLLSTRELQSSKRLRLIRLV